MSAKQPMRHAAVSRARLTVNSHRWHYCTKLVHVTQQVVGGLRWHVQENLSLVNHTRRTVASRYTPHRDARGGASRREFAAHISEKLKEKHASDVGWAPPPPVGGVGRRRCGEQQRLERRRGGRIPWDAGSIKPDSSPWIRNNTEQTHATAAESAILSPSIHIVGRDMVPHEMLAPAQICRGPPQRAPPHFGRGARLLGLQFHPNIL